MTSTSRRRARPRPLRIAAVLLMAAAIVTAIVMFVGWVAAPAAPNAEPSAANPAVVSDALPDASGVRWPDAGAAAAAIGDGPIEASSTDAAPMASISKLVTALMVLQEHPLIDGDQGSVYMFSEKWADNYEEYVARGQSAVELPIGGTLTQYQMIQGMLIGSASNYADILVETIWGSTDAFVDASRDFLAANGLDGITMVEPTGFDARNTATPGALIVLARLALANPVIAEIVAMRAVVLPGVGEVENTNDLLGDPGVVGLKTGTLDGANLLSAKDVTGPEGQTMRLYVAVVGQPDDEARFVESRALYAQLEERVVAGS